MKIQWDVIWSLLRTLLVAGGPVATLLIALDFPPVEVGKWLGIGLAGVGLLSVAVPGIIGALKRTDGAKVDAAANLPGVKVVVDTSSDSPAPAAAITAALDLNDPKNANVVPHPNP